MRVGNDGEGLPKYWEQRFGRRVKNLRTARVWTQDDLAKRMTAAGYPMHQTTVAKLENGSRPTHVGEVAALAAILGLSIDAMFSPDDEDEQMLLRLQEAAGELGRLGRELREHREAGRILTERFDEARERHKALREIASKMPGVQRHIANSDRLIELGEDPF